jgi:hypothetical protein
MCLQVGKDAVGKGSHEISRVVWDDSLESRNGTLHLALGSKSNDSKHGGTAIVNLLDKTGCLLLIGIVLANAKRIVQVPTKKNSKCRKQCILFCEYLARMIEEKKKGIVKQLKTYNAPPGMYLESNAGNSPIFPPLM